MSFLQKMTCAKILPIMLSSVRNVFCNSYGRNLRKRLRRFLVLALCALCRLDLLIQHHCYHLTFLSGKRLGKPTATKAWALTNSRKFKTPGYCAHVTPFGFRFETWVCGVWFWRVLNLRVEFVVYGFRVTCEVYGFGFNCFLILNLVFKFCG